ncbi:MAG: septal ring lytic transglycosylase RlpA family protein [Candidatus Latescibacterota bacterium]
MEGSSGCARVRGSGLSHLVFAVMLAAGTMGLLVTCSPNPMYRAQRSDRERTPRSDSTSVAYQIPTSVAYQIGEASYYADDFHGRQTSNGETFDMYGLTAAHPELPFGTKVRVTNLENGMSVEVRINDRGPFSKGRIIDLAYGAAQKIGLVESGLAEVKLEIVK